MTTLYETFIEGEKLTVSELLGDTILKTFVKVGEVWEQRNIMYIPKNLVPGLARYLSNQVILEVERGIEKNAG